MSDWLFLETQGELSLSTELWLVFIVFVQMLMSVSLYLGYVRTVAATTPRVATAVTVTLATRPVRMEKHALVSHSFVCAEGCVAGLLAALLPTPHPTPLLPISVFHYEYITK